MSTENEQMSIEKGQPISRPPFLFLPLLFPLAFASVLVIP
jgi:hypothetical protein